MLNHSHLPGHGPHFPFAQRRLRFQSHCHPLSLFWVPGRKLWLSLMELLGPATCPCVLLARKIASAKWIQVSGPGALLKEGWGLGVLAKPRSLSSNLRFTQKGKLIPRRNVSS